MRRGTRTRTFPVARLVSRAVASSEPVMTLVPVEWMSRHVTGPSWNGYPCRAAAVRHAHSAAAMPPVRRAAARLDVNHALAGPRVPLPQAAFHAIQRVHACQRGTRHAAPHLQSADAVHTARPSGVNAPQVTGPLWPANTCRRAQRERGSGSRRIGRAQRACMHAPSDAFQSQAVKSSEPASSTAPRGCHCSQSTPPPGPSRLRFNAPLLASLRRGRGGHARCVALTRVLSQRSPNQHFAVQAAARKQRAVSAAQRFGCCQRNCSRVEQARCSARA